MITVCRSHSLFERKGGREPSIVYNARGNIGVNNPAPEIKAHLRHSLRS